jgi:hypothetical protein
MIVLLDADALIKLNLAGILAVVAEKQKCVIPQAVYHEAVTNGIAAGYDDAQVIGSIVDDLVDDLIEVIPTIATTPSATLGRGEMAVYTLSTLEQDSLIISDDTRFLTMLKAMGRPGTTPAQFLVMLAGQGFLATEESKQALNNMRPAIRPSAYQRAIQDLEG